MVTVNNGLPLTYEPTFGLESSDCLWLMTRWERYAFSYLLQAIQPQVALEIGTYKGGSLQATARVAQKVYSLDIASWPREML